MGILTAIFLFRLRSRIRFSKTAIQNDDGDMAGGQGLAEQT
jgi:hypothetical protein